VSERFSSAVAAITSFVEKLDPEDGPSNVRSRREFGVLLDLAEVARIASTDWSLRSVVDVFTALAVRSSNSVRVLTATGLKPEIPFREGALQSLLNRVLILLEENACTEVTFDAVQQGSRLIVHLFHDVSVGLQQAVQSFQEGLFWQFIRAELQVLDIAVDGQRISIHMIPVLPEESFVNSALTAFHETCRLMSKSEAEVVAQLLHDLKNDLLAYDLALSAPQLGEMGKHKALLDASTHLDAASASVKSLAALRSGMTVQEW
jgi:hypothetical protein